MNPEIINRVINLIDKDNERVVLVDPDTGKAVVVMDFDAYERMKGGIKQPAVSVSQKIETPKIEPVETKTEMVLEIEPQSEPIKPIISPTEAKTPKPKPVKGKEKVEDIKSPYPPVSSKNDSLSAPAFSDLTQSELLDKINRDIATWKTVQERKREGELAAAAQEIIRPAVNDTFEEEERFYLEPVE
jgi:hypothetical protein